MSPAVPLKPRVMLCTSRSHWELVDERPQVLLQQSLDAEILFARSLDELANLSERKPPHILFLDPAIETGTDTRSQRILDLRVARKWICCPADKSPSFAPLVVLLTQVGENLDRGTGLPGYEGWEHLQVDFSDLDGLVRNIATTVKERLPRMRRQWQLSMSLDQVDDAWTLPRLAASHVAPEEATYLARDIVIQALRSQRAAARSVQILSPTWLPGYSSASTLILSQHRPRHSQPNKQHFLKLRPLVEADVELIRERRAPKHEHWRTWVLPYATSPTVSVGNQYHGTLTEYRTWPSLSEILMVRTERNRNNENWRSAVTKLLTALTPTPKRSPVHSIRELLSPTDDPLEQALQQLAIRVDGWAYSAGELSWTSERRRRMQRVPSRMGTYRVGTVTTPESVDLEMMFKGYGYDYVRMAHGDMHADNVLVNNGTVKIIDCTEMRETPYLFCDFARLEVSLHEMLVASRERSKEPLDSPDPMLFKNLRVTGKVATRGFANYSRLAGALVMLREHVADRAMNVPEPQTEKHVASLYLVDLFMACRRALYYLVAREINDCHRQPSIALRYFLELTHIVRRNLLRAT